MQNLPNDLIEFLNNLDPDLLGAISAVPEGQEGDFGFPTFILAKKRGKDPVECAKELEDQMMQIESVQTVKAVGPYENFTITLDGWRQMVANLDPENLSKTQNPQTIVVDYGGENVAKPLSVGHLRSNILGQAYVNIARFLGHKVVGDNHLGDWGTQFGKLAVAIKKWGDWKVIEKDPINELVALYQKFHVEAEKDESLNNEARAAFKALSEGDTERLQEWQKICDWTKKNLDEIHTRLKVYFDETLGESFYRGEKMEKAVEACKKASLTTENDDGSLAIIPKEEDNLPSFLIQKSDGTTLYHTSDLATIRYRLDTFQPDKIVYFVAEPQTLHFRQLFWLAEKLGWSENVELVHAAFGLVRLPEGKMSTRAGNVIWLEELLDEAKRRALAVLEEKQPDLPREEWEELAEKIGIGAVIYSDLYRDRTKTITFDWDTALSFDGQTAPYVQYTYARASAILRKAETKGEILSELNKQEEELILLMGKFEDILKKSFNEAKPSFLAQWLYDLANAFNKFYSTSPVLKADEKEKKTRLLLVKLVQNYIEKSLKLLGISETPKM